MGLSSNLRLYLVADPGLSTGDFTPSVEGALRGGVTMVQLRGKSLADRVLLDHAQTLRSLTAQYRSTFIVNDRMDIALASGADGVHLGVDDMPIESARSLGGSSFIIGYSPETDDQIRSAADRGADYLGIGPVFGTASKHDAGDELGLAEFARRIALTRLPTVGIGGISASNARSVIDAGASGVAVISAILGSDDTELVARQFS